MLLARRIKDGGVFCKTFGVAMFVAGPHPHELNTCLAKKQFTSCPPTCDMNA